MVRICRLLPVALSILLPHYFLDHRRLWNRTFRNQNLRVIFSFVKNVTQSEITNWGICLFKKPLDWACFQNACPLKHDKPFKSFFGKQFLCMAGPTGIEPATIPRHNLNCVFTDVSDVRGTLKSFSSGILFLIRRSNLTELRAPFAIVIWIRFYKFNLLRIRDDIISQAWLQ